MISHPDQVTMDHPRYLGGVFASHLFFTPKPTSLKWMEMVFSNHFLYKGLVHHPIDSQPFINGWPSWGSRFIYGQHHPSHVNQHHTWMIWISKIDPCLNVEPHPEALDCWWSKAPRQWKANRPLVDFEVSKRSREFFRTKKPKVWLFLLVQWLNFKLFGITYFVGKIKFKLFFSGSIGWVSFRVNFPRFFGMGL